MFCTEKTYDEDGRLLILHQEDADGRLKSHGEYAYMALEVSKEAAERYYEKMRRNPGEI